MANLTVALDDDLLKRARIRAVERGTSVNAVLREYLYEWTETGAQRMRAADHILALARASSAGGEGRTWSRDELYER